MPPQIRKSSCRNIYSYAVSRSWCIAMAFEAVIAERVSYIIAADA